MRGKKRHELFLTKKRKITIMNTILILMQAPPLSTQFQISKDRAQELKEKSHELFKMLSLSSTTASLPNFAHPESVCVIYSHLFEALRSPTPPNLHYLQSDTLSDKAMLHLFHCFEKEQVIPMAIIEFEDGELLFWDYTKPEKCLARRPEDFYFCVYAETMSSWEPNRDDDLVLTQRQEFSLAVWPHEDESQQALEPQNLTQWFPQLEKSLGFEWTAHGYYSFYTTPTQSVLDSIEALEKFGMRYSPKMEHAILEQNYYGPEQGAGIFREKVLLSKNVSTACENKTDTLHGRKYKI